MRNILIGLCSLFITYFGYSQQEAQYTQYMYNTVIINPAYAGSRGTTSIFALNRNQWVGVTGAPRTINLSGEMQIQERMGVGLTVVNDAAGPISENNIGANFSYSLPMGEEYHLAFGIRGGVDLLSVDFTKLTKDERDTYFAKNINNQVSPVVGFGLYLHSEKSYIGLSSPSLLSTKHYTDSDLKVATYISSPHIYLIGGHVFDLTDGEEALLLKPTFLLRYVQGSPILGDISLNTIINQKFIAGLAYRTTNTFAAMLGFKPTERWHIGYSYDLESSTAVKQISGVGSHEIFLKYEIPNRTNYIITPRFF